MSLQSFNKNRSSHRLVKNQLSSLVLHESIITTQAKAKKIKSEFEKIINVCKNKDSLNAYRMLKNILYGGALKKFFDQKTKYKTISLYKIGQRYGDNSKMVIVKINMNEFESKKQSKTKEING